MDMEAGKTLTNEEVIRELLELLKKNAMKEQANDVFEICSYVDGLEKKIDSMTEELTNMQNQIKEMQEDTLVNNAKKALSEAQERLNVRCEQIKSQVLEVKAQVKSTAKSIVDEAKAKGRAALYRVSEFLGIKKRLLDIRENVRGAIKTTDKDIAKTALLAKGFREAGQTAANAFRTFADKPEVDYSRKEQKHPITKAVLAPMKAVKKMLVSMELHLDASIDKLDNLAMNVKLDKEKHMENEKKQEQNRKISALLCAKEYETAEAVGHLKEELDSLKRTLVEKERQLVHIWAQSVPEEEKTVCMFSEDISADAMRQYVNEVLEKERILCAVFYGNDAAGYRYVIGSRTQDLRAFSKMLNAAFEGRGGGKPEMVQGTVKGEAGKIREWIQKIAEELSYEK